MGAVTEELREPKEILRSRGLYEHECGVFHGHTLKDMGRDLSPGPDFYSATSGWNLKLQQLLGSVSDINLDRPL